MTDHNRAAIFAAIDEVFRPGQRKNGAEIIARPDFTFRDLSDSSIKFVEFCMHVEESLDIEIEFSDLLDNPTLLTFLDWLNRQNKAG